MTANFFRRSLGCICALLLTAPASAEVVVPLRTIPANSVIAPEDLGFSDDATPGAVADPNEAVGLEARVALYAGRPIRPSDLRPPALVERNAVIPLVYRSGALTIVAEGRALDRAALGEAVRVINLSSRVTLTAVVGADGAAHVGALP